MEVFIGFMIAATNTSNDHFIVKELNDPQVQESAWDTMKYIRFVTGELEDKAPKRRQLCILLRDEPVADKARRMQARARPIATAQQLLCMHDNCSVHKQFVESTDCIVEVICMISKKARNKLIHALGAQGNDECQQKMDAKKALDTLANGSHAFTTSRLRKTAKTQKAILDKCNWTKKEQLQQTTTSQTKTNRRKKKERNHAQFDNDPTPCASQCNPTSRRVTTKMAVCMCFGTMQRRCITSNSCTREKKLLTLHSHIPTTSVPDEVKVVARLHKVDSGPSQLPKVRKLTEGNLWTTGVVNPLKLRTAPVVMKGKATDNENVNSEYHDNYVYNSTTPRLGKKP